MGDWCGPKSDTDRTKTGVRNLDDQFTAELIQAGEEILLRRKVRAYLTCRLMGDLIDSFRRKVKTIPIQCGSVQSLHSDHFEWNLIFHE